MEVGALNLSLYTILPSSQNTSLSPSPTNPVHRPESPTLTYHPNTSLATRSPLQPSSLHNAYREGRKILAHRCTMKGKGTRRRKHRGCGGDGRYPLENSYNCSSTFIYQTSRALPPSSSSPALPFFPSYIAFPVFSSSSSSSCSSLSTFSLHPLGTFPLSFQTPKRLFFLSSFSFQNVHLLFSSLSL